MSLPTEVGEAVGTTLGTVLSATILSGGDINDAYRVEVRGRGSLFLKLNHRAPTGFFEAEARGLDWLREARALRVPEVVMVSPPSCRIRFLVLEDISSAPQRSPKFDEELGRGLAELHRSGVSGMGFGFEDDNFIGTLPQSNRRHDRWVDFFRAERLEPTLRMAGDGGRMTASLHARFDRLFERLGEFVGPDEAPARLHGDLWNGNLLVDEQGRPTIIDPAVYGGHREMDLAMMQLFGGFSGRVFDAYRAAYPLSGGWKERVPLYQLYPLLVHVVLFGGGYVASVERALARLP